MFPARQRPGLRAESTQGEGLIEFSWMDGLYRSRWLVSSSFVPKQERSAGENSRSDHSGSEKIEPGHELFLVSHSLDAGHFVQCLLRNAGLGPAAACAGGRPESDGAEQENRGENAQSIFHGVAKDASIQAEHNSTGKVRCSPAGGHACWPDDGFQ